MHISYNHSSVPAINADIFDTIPSPLLQGNIIYLIKLPHI